jgi:hypothetical protein
VDTTSWTESRTLDHLEDFIIKGAFPVPLNSPWLIMRSRALSAQPFIAEN